VGDDDDDAKKTLKYVRKAPAKDAPTVAVHGSDELARAADARVSAKEEAKWRALFDSGLVNLESVPVLQGSVSWSRCDDVEVRVLLRARSGAKIASILEDATYSSAQIRGALCRLASRGVLQIP
jgi:hypothetical protein